MFENNKDILLSNACRLKISQGIDLVAKIYRKTLGTNSKDFIDQIVKEISKDKFEAVGFDYAIQLAKSLNEKCSDGTATSIIIFDILVKDALKLLNKGVDLFLIINMLDKTLHVLLDHLEKLSYQIKSENELLQVALRYTNQNAKLAKIITYSIEQVKKNGIILLNNDQTSQTSIENTTCLSFNTGYTSTYFCNNLEHKTIEFNLCDVLILTKKISAIQEILPLLNDRAFSNKELLIISEDVSKDVVASLALNNLKKIFKIALIELPISNKHLLFGLNCAINGKFINKNFVIGSLKKVIITKDSTYIIPFEKLLQNLEFEKKTVLINFKSLGITNEKKFYKALKLTQLSYNHKIVAGGGISLVFALQKLLNEQNSNLIIGTKLFQNALIAPFEQLVKNSNLNHSQILKKIIKLDYPFGFNIENRQIENFKQSNICDSKKVIQTSLAYAVKFTKKVLLTGAMIVDNS